jgi:hypothetical protein
MNVDMGAGRDRGGGFTDWTAVLNDLVIERQLAHGDFVAQRHIGSEFDGRDELAFQRDDPDLGSGSQIHDRYADVVFGFVDQNSMFHKVLLLFWLHICSGYGMKDLSIG